MDSLRGDVIGGSGVRCPSLSSGEALARLERLAVPQRLRSGSAVLPQDGLGAVPGEHRAVLDAAVGTGSRIVAVTMADAQARRALLADWARRAGEFPGGRVYFDMDDLRVDGAGDPSAVLAWLLVGLGVREELVPHRYWERGRALRQLAVRQPAVVVLDGARQAAEVRGAACPQGVLLVGGERRIDALAVDGAVQLDLDGPDRRCGEEALEAAAVSLSPEGRTLYRLLGSLPVSTTGSAMAEVLLGAAAGQAVAELRGAGLLEDGGRPGRFRLSRQARALARAVARSQPSEEHLRDLETVTGACLEVVEKAAAALTSPGTAGTERRAALETLDSEQYLVGGLLRRISGRHWHRQERRLAAALLPLYRERTYSSWWRDSLTRGIDGAFWDGAADAQAELCAQLARMELRYGDDDEERRADSAADRAQELLGQVGSDRVRGRIWQSRAEAEDHYGRDPVPGWEEARRWYEAAGDRADEDAAAVRLGEALVAAGQAERALALLTGGTAPSGAHAALVRAAAFQVLGRPGPALAEAVAAAEEAVRTRRYRLCDQALRLLCDLAEEQRDGRLLRVCRNRRTELGEAAGLGARWLEEGPGDPADDSRL